MKKIVTLLTVAVMLLTFSVQALAVQFVPSIEYKGAPVLVTKDVDGKEIAGSIKDADGVELSAEEADCVIITPVADEKDAESELLKRYNELKEKGEDVFGDQVEKDMVVRDLFAVSSECEKMNELMPVAGNTIALTFDLNLGANAPVAAMIYANNAWTKLPVVNNGDGTVTATFEDLGVVAFLTETTADGPDTGDDSAKDMALWISLMVVSAGAIVALLVVARRKKAEK